MLPHPLGPSVRALIARFCDCLLSVFPQENEHSWEEETCHGPSNQRSPAESAWAHQ